MRSLASKLCRQSIPRLLSTVRDSLITQVHTYMKWIYHVHFADPRTENDWRRPSTRRRFLHNFAFTLGFDPLVADNWISVGVRAFRHAVCIPHSLYSMLFLINLLLGSTRSVETLWRISYQGCSFTLPRIQTSVSIASIIQQVQ